jgi:hypothetical protein
VPCGGWQSQRQISDRWAGASATSETRTAHFVALFSVQAGFVQDAAAQNTVPVPHQISFKANWICLEVVTVEVIAPAPASRAPVLSKRALLSTGGEKFG